MGSILMEQKSFAAAPESKRSDEASRKGETGSILMGSL